MSEAFLLPGLDEGGGFTPRSLASLALWLVGGKQVFQDSAFTTAAVADADPIGGWKDQSGQVHNATQPSDNTARPTLKKAIINGLDVTRFDGSNDYLTLGNVSGFFSALANEWSVFALLQLSNVTGNPSVLLGKDNTGQRYAILGTALGSIYSEFNGVGKATGVISLSANTPYVLEWHQSGSSNTFEQRANGVVDGSGTAGSGASSAAEVYLGNRQISNRPFPGDMAQVVGYNRRLLTTEASQVRKYLGKLGGVTVT